MPQLRPVGMNIIYDGHTPTKTGSSPPSFITSPTQLAQANLSSLRSELKDLEKGVIEGQLDSKEHKEIKNKAAETAEKEQLTDRIDVKETSTGTCEYSRSMPVVWKVLLVFTISLSNIVPHVYRAVCQIVVKLKIL